MFNVPVAKELAQLAIDEALRLGVGYVDVRYEAIWYEQVRIQSGRLEFAHATVQKGLGVRVLLEGAWGFAAVSEPTRHDTYVVVRKAVESARASAILQDSPVTLTVEEPRKGDFRTDIVRDPMGVPLEDKVNLLTSVDQILRAPSAVTSTKVCFQAQKLRKLYLNSEGADLEQDLTCCGVDLQATASNGSDFQTRTYPGSTLGSVLGGGWEVVEALPLHERAEIVAQQATELLGAGACVTGPTTVILAPEMVANHALHGLAKLLTLDRLMGSHQGAQGSFIRPSDLTKLQVADASIHIASDGHHLGGAGRFGFDDEGTPAQRVELVQEGRVTSVLSGRELAARGGFEQSTGAMRAPNWATPPCPTPSNIIVEPGTGGDLEALIADTPKGVLFEGPGWLSLDHQGRTFVGGSELGWMIEGGRRVRLLKNPIYRGSTLSFWRDCGGVADASDWRMAGDILSLGANRGGVPIGRGASSARFLDVEVGSVPPSLLNVDDQFGLPLVRRPKEANELKRASVQEDSE